MLSRRLTEIRDLMIFSLLGWGRDCLHPWCRRYLANPYWQTRSRLDYSWRKSLARITVCLGSPDPLAVKSLTYRTELLCRLMRSGKFALASKPLIATQLELVEDALANIDPKYARISGKRVVLKVEIISPGNSRQCSAIPCRSFAETRAERLLAPYSRSSRGI